MTDNNNQKLPEGSIYLEANEGRKYIIQCTTLLTGQAVKWDF